MNYVWETEYNPEDGEWYCQKLVYMGVPDIVGPFDSETTAVERCVELNEEGK